MNITRYLLVISGLSYGFISSGQILIGPVVGGQASFISFDDKANKDLYTTKPYTGFHAGAAISFRVRKDFFLQGSILYSVKGKTMDGKQDAVFHNTVKYQYIDMPILYTKEYKFQYKKNQYYKVQLGVGPIISYWLGGKGKIKNSDLNENGVNPPAYDLPYHITFGKDPADVVQGEMNVQYPNRVQLGLTFSVGVILEPNKLNKIMVTGRYDLGHSFLSPLSKGDFGLGPKLNYEDDLRIRIQGVSFSVFYFIDLNTENRNKGKSNSNVK